MKPPKLQVYLLIALAIAGASAQEAANEQNAAPEPYAYAYQTDSSSASEQRTPDGKVTGYYTIVDPTDGRERRVEYFADETGFHAKVATNELGTKSENSADVEISASPPTEAQLVYQAPAQQQVRQQFVSYQAPQQQQFSVYQQQQPQQRVVTSFAQAPAQAVTSTVVKQTAPAVRQSYSYVQQPAIYGTGYNYGYYPGYGYQNAYGSNQNAAYGVYGLNGGSYNYHTPAQYYSRYTTSGVQQPATYTTVGGGQNVYSRYVSSSSGGSVPVGGATYTYSSAPVAASTRTVTTSGSSSNLGSGNLLLLKK